MMAAHPHLGHVQKVNDIFCENSTVLRIYVGGMGPILLMCAKILSVK